MLVNAKKFCIACAYQSTFNNVAFESNIVQVI